MIPNAKVREIDSGGVSASAGFGISLKDSAHIMTILRDTLYSDKVLAVLREYSANAWDAHREVGKGDLPIEITLPTVMEPTLAIRDFGPGLSHDDVFQVFTQYGASTKRDNNSAVGMLGIGSKSGFAYSDSFTIMSWNGGKKRIYAAVLDESDKGTINLLHEEDCGEETGVLIQIAVRKQDIKEFEEKAKNLFQYFVPRPVINLELPPEPPEKTALKHGVLFGKHGWRDHVAGDTQWVAVMGCVPYVIDLNQLKDAEGEYLFSKYIRKVSGVLYFDIGDVQVNASREALKYSEGTRKKLIEKFDLLVDEYVLLSLMMIESGGFTLWEKRTRARTLSDLDLPLPDAWKDIAADYLDYKGPEPKTFLFGKQGPTQHLHLAVVESARFLVRDDERKLDGYDFERHDYLCRPVEGATTDEVKAEVEMVIKSMGIDGIPILLLSETLDWVNPVKPKPKKHVSEKHKVKTFVLKPNHHYGHPWSSNWDIVDRVPQPDDVFVILEKFQAVADGSEFDVFGAARSDHFLLEYFKKEMPAVYGYKNTKKKPLDPTKIVGKHYPVWRLETTKTLLTPEIEKALSIRDWASSAPQAFGYRKADWLLGIKKLIEILGKNHPVTMLYRKQKTAYLAHAKFSDTKQKVLKKISKRLGMEDTSESMDELEKLKGQYPMLKNSDFGMTDFIWDTDADVWIDYVKTIDNYNKLVAMVRDGE